MTPQQPSGLFDTEGFPPRWQCGEWSDLHGWIHIASDTVTACAYFAIPLVIAIYLRRRPDIPFPGLFWLFAAFILSCGLVHLIEASIFWQPWYRFSGAAKVLTAVVSTIAVFGVVRVLPRALELPGLAAVNERLMTENRARRRAEHELLRRNEDLDGFVYVASHDLKAPLRALTHLSSWIEEDAGEVLPERSKEHLATLRNRVGRMGDLLDGLLVYSRVGRDRTEAEDLDMAALVQGAADVSGLPSAATITLGDLPGCRAPRAAMELVLRNVLSNAVKHTDKDAPTIEVRGEPVAGGIDYFVTDDGPGVPASERERVFRAFQTLRPRDQVEGSGLGLAIVRRAVESFGGRVGIVPNEGRGTTVRIHVPDEQTSNDNEDD